MNLIARLLGRNKEANPIKYKHKRYSYDCTQTCLDMLGYDGHQMFPDKAMTTKDLKSIPGVELILDDDTTPDSTIPQFFEQPNLILCSDSLIEEYPWHCVLAFKDKVYCPDRGVRPASEYLKKVWVHEIYEIPFKR